MGRTYELIIVDDGSTDESFETLRQVELRYRSIFENAIHGIYQSTPAGRFLNVNPALARMLGYDSPADMIASCTDIALDYYAEPLARAEFLALLSGRGVVQGFEVQVRRKDGTTIWTRENVHAVSGQHGQLLYYEGSVEDVTAQKQAEQALRDSEERYRNLFQNANDVIYTMDLEGRYTSVNKVGEHVTGYSQAELCQMNFAQLVAPEHLPLSRGMMERKLNGGETTTFYEIEIVNRAGARVLLEVSTQLIYQHGRAVGVQAGRGGTARIGGTLPRAIRERQRHRLYARSERQLHQFEQDGRARHGLHARGGRRDEHRAGGCAGTSANGPRNDRAQAGGRRVHSL